MSKVSPPDDESRPQSLAERVTQRATASKPTGGPAAVPVSKTTWPVCSSRIAPPCCTDSWRWSLPTAPATESGPPRRSTVAASPSTCRWWPGPLPRQLPQPVHPLAWTGRRPRPAPWPTMRRPTGAVRPGVRS